MKTARRRAAMSALVGYRNTRLLRDSDRTRVFAAVRERDQQAVVIELHDLDEAEGLDRQIAQEFRAIQALEIDGLSPALALEQTASEVALVRAWSPDITLRDYAGAQALGLREFMILAQQLVRILCELHGRRLIHRNLKPSNIFVDPPSLRLTLAEVGVSVLLERERRRIDDPWVVDGLHYLAPEQSGRTHHEVDLRSDLYALGVIFYELLTGARPFVAGAPLELIHAHLARRPQPPQWHRPELPTALSAMTMKLLEKAPERRYQSARGLLADLDSIAAALQAGAPLDRFTLARDDLPAQVQLPHRLYGRSREIGALAQRYREVGEGRAHCVLVVGPAGVGKTALVDQLAEPVLARHGYFARGRCERDQHDKPYAGIFAAFAALADQLLTRSDAELAGWGQRLRARLGPSAAVLAELVPTLRPVLGPLPPALGLGPLESRNRLALACVGLIAEFARVEHPLLLSLDDMQWADAASCELFASLLDEPGAALLLVATVRPDALEPDSPMQALLARVERRPQVSRIDVGPLADDEVAALIADALAWPVERVQSLAEIIGRSTGKNPLFIGQYLRHLFERGLLRVDADGWTWEAEAIEAAGVPEDLLAMLAAKLELLTAAERELLTAAAVIGQRFDTAVLGDLVAGEILDAALLPLVREGLLAPLRDGRYGFSHERIRSAVYRRSTPAHRAALHQLVGESCLERSGHGELDESFFDLVDHLDLGCGLMSFDDEDPALARERARVALATMADDRRSMLAEFNALAGHNALISAAPKAAIRYFEAGIALVGGVDEFEAGVCDGSVPVPVHIDHELRFALELGRCQALGLAGEIAAAERGFDRLLQAPLDFARVGRAVAGRVEIRIAADDRLGAIACGLSGLARLGVEPIKPNLAPDDFPINRLVPMLRSRQLREIGERQPLHAPRLEAALEVLTALIPVSHLVDPEAHVAFVTEHIHVMLEHGRFRSAPMALAYAAMIVGTAVGQRQLALEIAELARTLARHQGPGSHRQHIEPPYWVVASWVRPHAEGLGPLRECVEQALATGDLEIASYATDTVVSMSLSAGVPLSSLERTADDAARRLRQWQAGPLVVRTEAACDLIRQLTCGDEASLQLGPVTVDVEHRPSAYMIRTLRAFARCLFGRWQEALDELEAMDDFQRVVFGAWQLCDQALLHGLSAAAVCAELPPEERETLLWITRLAQELLAASAELGPDNCRARASLLEAEILAAEERAIEALSAYTRCHRQAAEAGILWLEALAFERSADFLRRLDLDELADGALRDARARYLGWGAFTKVAALDRRRPGLVDESGPITARRELASVEAPTASRALDLASILKASQAIAANIELTEVVARVLAIALENAGAQRGALLLVRVGLELTALCSAEVGEPAQAILPAPRPLETADELVPVSLLRWVERTREPLLLADAILDPRFAGDAYIARHGLRSVLCLPIVKHERLIGALYLENRLNSGSFTRERLEVLDLLMAQAASALENAQLFAALRGSEVRWRSLVEGLPDVVLLIDRLGGVEFVNHVTGVDLRRTLAATVDTLVHPDDSDALHEQLSRAVHEFAQAELELRASLRGNEPRWYSLRLAPIAVDGQVDRVIAVATDITERREAALAKERLEAQLRQQQRLESIGTLASGVAHEINNPVQGIMNYAELIATRPDSSETVREFADEIGYESQRVAAIVRGLLSFSRAEADASASAAIDLRSVVDGTLLLVRTVIGKDQIEIDVDMPDEPVVANCREQQIRQVLMNLVTNARDALRARWPEYHPDKRIGITVAGFTAADGAPWARISVRDRGGGVPDELVARIFDPFFTTKGRDQGTGLGLSVSHGIIHEHGGNLRLDNQPGVGACFHLELPLDGATPVAI